MTEIQDRLLRGYDLPASCLANARQSALSQGNRALEPIEPSDLYAVLVPAGAAAPRLERFKTSDVFDGTAKNPQWMG